MHLRTPTVYTLTSLGVIRLNLKCKLSKRLSWNRLTLYLWKGEILVMLFFSSVRTFLKLCRPLVC